MNLAYLFTKCIHISISSRLTALNLCISIFALCRFQSCMCSELFAHYFCQKRAELLCFVLCYMAIFSCRCDFMHLLGARMAWNLICHTRREMREISDLIKKYSFSLSFCFHRCWSPLISASLWDWRWTTLCTWRKDTTHHRGRIVLAGSRIC